jgi:hypothetical protein
LSIEEVGGGSIESIISFGIPSAAFIETENKIIIRL